MNAGGSALGMQGGLHWECKGCCIGNAGGSALGMQGVLHWECKGVCIHYVWGGMNECKGVCIHCVVCLGVCGICCPGGLTIRPMALWSDPYIFMTFNLP